MKKNIWLVIVIFMIGVLAACNNGTNKEEAKESEEPKILNVDFIVPEKANAGEKVELKAIVTYGDEKVKDADVNFEYWEQGNKEGSKRIEPKNNGDGTYTAELTFDHDGVYEMYAHTTARDFHSMPLRSITIGEGASAHHEEGHDEQAGDHGHGHAEGFAMHFMEPKDVKVNQNTPLTVHLQMENQPLKEAKVRYAIFQEHSEKHDWVDALEAASGGEYTASYSFKEQGAYTIVIHVTNDAGLHEHQEHKVEVAS